MDSWENAKQQVMSLWNAGHDLFYIADQLHMSVLVVAEIVAAAR